MAPKKEKLRNFSFSKAGCSPGVLNITVSFLNIDYDSH
jgi:hypothetical protein